MIYFLFLIFVFCVFFTHLGLFVFDDEDEEEERINCEEEDRRSNKKQRMLMVFVIRRLKQADQKKEHRIQSSHNEGYYGDNF